ncbi:hypothetical protein ACOJBY_16425 [Enterococcus entomosocium]|uniref:hypothetical protein n=1 Tax=Enterococcus entomosocium TaxID=3034352 RepID=UPI003B5B9BCC
MYKILLIEDQESDITSCSDTVERLNIEHDNKYELLVAKTFDEGRRKLKDYADCAIIDIKLDNKNSGNDLLKIIQEDLRIPVAVMTGTPDTNLEESSPIKIFKKGEKTYQDIIELLYDESSTGLFKVIGGKGIIEETMNKIFWKNLYPNIDVWKSMKERQDEINTEEILLRYAIGHIQEILDSETTYQVEEMYICPPISPEIRTGSILKNKSEGTFSIVLSPPCDLAVRTNGKMKTDFVMLVKIENTKEIIDNYIKIQELGNKKSKKRFVEKIVKNTYSDYYHWLPDNYVFSGGLVNFRMVSTFSPEELEIEFEKPALKVQDHFVKSLLSRFSSYYARQGQPDFYFDYETNRILETLE